jgi:hypothetical protein
MSDPKKDTILRHIQRFMDACGYTHFVRLEENPREYIVTTVRDTILHKFKQEKRYPKNKKGSRCRAYNSFDQIVGSNIRAGLLLK